MSDAFIYDGLRSAFGRHGGALAAVRPDDLLARVVSALVERNRFAPEDYEDLIAGNTNQAVEDSRNLARHAALLAGLPVSVAGMTVNRLCGSGLAAVADAARVVRTGGGENSACRRCRIHEPGAAGDLASQRGIRPWPNIGRQHARSTVPQSKYHCSIRESHDGADRG